MRALGNILLTAALPILAAGQAMATHPVYESKPIFILTGKDATASDRLDELVLGRLNELGITPSLLCSDAVFLRRAFLCTTGTLPTARDARYFLESTEPDRRSKLIDHLLEREEFADYWAMKWGDLLRVKAEFPIKLWPNAAQAYHRWIYTSIRENKPYHEFARGMLTSSGSNFRQAESNFYRAMQDRSPRGIASTVALTFMGERTEHWPRKKIDAVAGFFAQIGYKSTAEWKEEIVFWNPAADEEGLTEGAIFPDGRRANIKQGREDPREVFADWLLHPDNPSFSRNISNRVWAWLMGRGIIHEPDDIRPDNPPCNPALLEFLEEQFIASKCDMKQLFSLILKSQAFQLSPIPMTDHPEAEAHFAHYPLRRMEAEVLIDALNQVTGTKESYSSPIPEPFTFVPEDVRAVELADGSITSSFLELFGRPPRDTGLESERSRKTTAAQRLHLLNSSHIRKKIKASPLVMGAHDGESTVRAFTETAYLTILSRPPTAEEVKRVERHATATHADARALAVDLVWALINQPEFYYIH